MDLGATMSRLWQEAEWDLFYAQYCAGRNITHPLCAEFRWWAAGIAGLIAAVVLILTVRRLRQIFGIWRHGHKLAEVADAETMDKYRWSGFAATPDAKRPRSGSK